MNRLAAIVVVLAVVSAACSDGGSVETEPPGLGQLVILDGDGDVVVLDPDGSNRLAITDDAERVQRYFQPIWSPGADRIAFSRTSRDGRSEMVTRDLAFSIADRIEAPAPPFYFSWSPDGTRLAYLSAAGGPDGLRLDIIDSSGEPVASDTGQPYYFTWIDGDSLVVHTGTERMAVIGSSEADQPAFSFGPPGAFRTPVWTEAGIVYVERGAGSQLLVRTDRAGERDVLAEITATTTFVISPDGQRVAVQLIGDAQDGLSASYQQAPLLPRGRLLSLDLTDGGWESVTDDPVTAFWWSPSGDSLLVLGVEDRDTASLSWRLWDEERGLRNAGVFVPDPSFVRDLLPFFEQYATSMSFWAPDGSAFAFPGSVEGEAGIWIVDAETLTARKVADGSWVAWSPH